MTELPADPIGAAWLARAYDVVPLGPLAVVSQVGGRRSTEVNDGFRLETYPEAMRPPANPAAHLQFHLRHEVPHLEFLARLFERTGLGVVQAWVAAEPTGRARGKRHEHLLRAGARQRQPGGDAAFLPDGGQDRGAGPGGGAGCGGAVWRAHRRVRRRPPGARGGVDDPAGEQSQLRYRRGGRSGGAGTAFRRRHGAAQGGLPLDDAGLADLQREILGERTTIQHFGVRQSPVFVGEMVRYQEVVHYVAPPDDAAAAMLQGLRVFLERTRGQSSTMRSAVAAFGFVYIHPLADGNGRVHRFTRAG